MMKRINSRHVCILLNLLLFINGCSKSEKALPRNETVGELLVAAIDSLERTYNFKSNQFLIHSELPSDYIRGESVSRLSKDLITDSVSSTREKLELLNLLSEVVNDSLKVDFREVQTKYARLLFYETPTLLHDKNFSGTFEMSKPVFDSLKSRSAFYLAIHCGKECSAGYIFFTVNENGIWRVDDFYRMWASKKKE
ncbi:MAG TPA: hypothetical protein VGK59_19440 [Ohtaekwangia sp.]